MYVWVCVCEYYRQSNHYCNRRAPPALTFCCLRATVSHFAVANAITIAITVSCHRLLHFTPVILKYSAEFFTFDLQHYVLRFRFWRTVYDSKASTLWACGHIHLNRFALVFFFLFLLLYTTKVRCQMPITLATRVMVRNKKVPRFLIVLLVVVVVVVVWGEHVALCRIRVWQWKSAQLCGAKC